MGFKGTSKYPPETIEAVVGYWKKSWSASDIAHRMDLTKGQVIGIVHRALQGKVVRKSKRSPEAKEINKAVAESPAPVFVPRNIGMPKPKSLDVPLEDLAAGQCKFPHGDGPFVFCGRPAEIEKPYCKYHDKLTHNGGAHVL